MSGRRSWTLEVLRREDNLPGLPAKIRWILSRHLRRHDGEVCHRCGRVVVDFTGSFWHASDELWDMVVARPERFGGPDFGILCPPCFTQLADNNGILIRWEPHPEPSDWSPIP